MQYNIYINSVKCLKWGLSLNQGALFDLLYRLPGWAEDAVINGQTYYYISREKIIQEMPLAFQKTDTVYRAMKVLAAKELIDWLKLGGKDMVRVTQKGASWHADPVAETTPSYRSVYKHQIIGQIDKVAENTPSTGRKSDVLQACKTRLDVSAEVGALLKSEHRNLIQQESEINPNTYKDDHLNQTQLPPLNPPKGKKKNGENFDYHRSHPDEKFPAVGKKNREDFDESFEEFWALYPKGRAGNKQRAQRAYGKALIEKRATRAQLLAAAKLYAASDEVAKGFAKGCAAWLNDDRFNSAYNSQNGLSDDEKTRLKKLEEDKRSRAQEAQRQMAADRLQEEINRQKHRLFAEFLQNKGYYSRAALAVNNRPLYEKLKQEFDRQFEAYL